MSAFWNSYQAVAAPDALEWEQLASGWRARSETLDEIVGLIPAGVDRDFAARVRFWIRAVPLVVARTAERSASRAYSLPSTAIIVFQEVAADPVEFFLDYAHEAAHDLIQAWTVGWPLSTLAGFRNQFATMYFAQLEAELAKKKYRGLRPEDNETVAQDFRLKRSVQETERAIEYVSGVWGPLRLQLTRKLGLEETAALAVRIQRLMSAIAELHRPVGEAFAFWVELRRGKIPSTAHTLTVLYALRCFYEHGRPGDGTGPSEDGSLASDKTENARARRANRLTAGTTPEIWLRGLHLLDEIARASDTPEQAEDRVQLAALLATAFPLHALSASRLVDRSATDLDEVVRWSLGDPLVRLEAISRNPHWFLDAAWGSEESLARALAELDIVGRDGRALPDEGNAATADVVAHLIFGSSRAKRMRLGSYDSRQRDFASPTRREMVIAARGREDVRERLPTLVTPPHETIALNPLSAVLALEDLVVTYEMEGHFSHFDQN